MKDKIYLLGRSNSTGAVSLTPKENPNQLITGISPARQKQIIAFMQARCVGCGMCEGASGITQTGEVLTKNNEVVNKGQSCAIATGGNFILPQEGVVLEDIKLSSASNQA